MPTVAILGAHTAVAKGIAEVVVERDLELDLIRATTVEALEADLTLIDESAFDASDLIILASEPEAKTLALAAARLKKPILDLTGVFDGDENVTWLWPGLDDDAGAVLEPGTISVIPLGMAVPIVSALSPLCDLGLQGIVGTVLESAASAGQPGMDELSAQIRSVFSMREATPERFRASLAFNAIPTPVDEGLDAALARAVHRGLSALGSPPDVSKIRLHRIQIPTFSAEAALLELTVRASPVQSEVEAGLRSAPGIRFISGDPPPALDAVGRDDALVGRLQVGPNRISLWVASDRLRRGSATLAALVLERWLRGA